MLHYRLFVEVNDPPGEVEKRASEQLHSWVRSNRLDADALTVGREVSLGPAATGSLAEVAYGSGDRFLRAVIREGRNTGTWTTRLTVHTPVNGRTKPWLWLDLTGPDRVQGKPPRLSRDLLGVFNATTGSVRQGQAQLVQDVDEVRDLVEAVCDPARRTLIFVAGSDPRLPMPAWTRHVRTLLRDTVGLAGGYVLTPAATAEFNNAIGPVHAVNPWTLRTFRSGVEPDDDEDGRRHKILSHERIVADSTSRLAYFLGRRAREAALDTPLPPIATRVDRAFAERINADLVASLGTTDDAVPTDRLQLAVTRPETVTTVTLPGGMLPDAVDEHQGDRADESGRTPDGDPLVESGPPDVTTGAPTHTDPVLPEGAPTVWQALERVLGDGPLTVERVIEWGTFAERGRRIASNREAIASHLDAYETRVTMLEAERGELRRRLQDSQLEIAVAEDEHARAAAEVRRLRKLLVNSDQAAQVWIPDEATELSLKQRPQDCEDLASKLDTWHHITFTGEVDELLDLDQHDQAGGWAGKIWDAFGALEDYAQAVLNRTFDGNVHNYLSDTPAGLRTFSATRHANDESPQVRNSSKLASLRTLPVPTEVDPSGTIFMGAHFKIAQSGMISPRLHYHNDIRGTGRIYVGYIGKHLRNTQTN
ncbi:hypothetical protein BLA60_17955 [Actinophytocola xinjiangensis]|uniref:Uncharacterized protein n=1 Tax=Actinophytocola xinjiangensis TaxID=485602 RepID=A0A7Z0WKS2_9PSEU|nr:hypothetical protein [Actinophytocola xinjiangensis]OLF09677.1 hypothetical protein BLA60_17955 [Actinophytocola xinjiangensis]